MVRDIARAQCRWEGIEAVPSGIETLLIKLLEHPIAVSAMRADKRAVNQVIATILLIAVAVAAVSAFYLFYRGFIRQGEKDASRESPSITIVGPNSASSGRTIVLTAKNTGSVDFATYAMVEGHAGSGTNLKRGGQVSFSTVLSGPGPWPFTIQGVTTGGQEVEDSWVVEPV
jgi:FlaG/FlaF family flagellin (archaellin)